MAAYEAMVLMISLRAFIVAILSFHNKK
ncbi:putative holin-like toxin [Oceanobacillus sp. 1P07AA]